MEDRTDNAGIDPVLELTIGPSSLECSRTLSTVTRRHMLEALELVLDGKPRGMGIDVSGLRVVDVDGANALVAMQRMVRKAGLKLSWRGLATQHVGTVPR
jgi:anti-anti-sigma regulatory factor